MEAQPNCLTCRHYRVTWEPAFPNSCTIFGFKSRGLPSREVYRDSGRPCPAHEERPRPAP